MINTTTHNNIAGKLSLNPKCQKTKFQMDIMLASPNQVHHGCSREVHMPLILGL